MKGWLLWQKQEEPKIQFSKQRKISNFLKKETKWKVFHLSLTLISKTPLMSMVKK